MKVILVLIASMAQVCFAGLAQDFDLIKNTGRDLEPTGAICEEVAKLRFAEKYPEPQYRVYVGIEYSDSERTVGELDIVVMNNETQSADVIAEVKCWKAPKNGLKKAHEQRARFLTNVHSGKALKFSWIENPSVALRKAQFNTAKIFLSVAQSGAKADGFDEELPYTLKELMDLRSDILRCQDSGQCPKPSR